MKICFLASANSAHSYRWIKYFSNVGHEVSWISLSSFSFGQINDGIDFYQVGKLPGRILRIVEAYLKVKKLIREINPDILHAHYAGMYGLLGALTGFHPLIITAWGSDIFLGFKSPIKSTLIKFALKEADLISCGADSLIDVMVKNGIPKNKIKLVYYGVETDKFMPQVERDRIRKELKLSDSPVIISARNFVKTHDIETIIKCIPFVLREFPEALFIIAGEGEQEKYLKILAARIKVLNNIRFIGKYSHERIIDYLSAADIYVSTALSDGGLSASTSEAMACGLPVVITDVADNKKWVTDGKGGFIIPVKSPKILADKIVYLLRNKDERIKFGRINRILIEEKNNYYEEMKKMDEVYKKVLTENTKIRKRI